MAKITDQQQSASHDNSQGKNTNAAAATGASNSPVRADLQTNVLKYLTGRAGTSVKLSDLQAALRCNPNAAVAAAINEAVATLQKAGKVHVEQQRWQEPAVSVLNWPTRAEQWSTWSCPGQLDGAEVVELMRQHGVTITELARRMQITQKRIREVRDRHGLVGRNTIRDWVEAITQAPDQQQRYSLEDHSAFRRRIKSGEVSAAEWRDNCNRMLASRTHFISELQSKYNAGELRNIASNLGEWSAGRNTKYENAKAVYRRLLHTFLIRGGVSYNPLQETLEDAIAREVGKLDQANLDDYFADRHAHQQQLSKALTSPESLEEFETFVAHRREEELNDEQLARFDALRADQSREQRLRDSTSATVSQLDSSNGIPTLRITEGYHAKRQCKLWIVQLTERVDRAMFQTLREKATQLDGWYSSFVPDQAGFQFLTEETARKFSALTRADQDRSTELDARRDRQRQSVAVRLGLMAAELHRKCDEVLQQSRESLQNTPRRAEMQAGVRGRAYADQATAHTIARLAAAFQTDTAKYLDGIAHKTHVETLLRIAKRAKSSYDSAMRHRNAANVETPDESTTGVIPQAHLPISTAVVRHAAYPYPTIWKSHLQEAVRLSGRARGAKQACVRMTQRLKSEKGQFVTFTEHHDIQQLAGFLRCVHDAGHSTDWMDRALDDYKRLRAANIVTLPELRCALRELLPLLADAASDTPVERAERALIGQPLPGFFPTPARVIERMLELAAIEAHHRILEPSVGKGDIADAIRLGWPDNFLTVVEINRSLADVLTAKGYEPVFGDFLQFGTGEVYDRIVMNPPFERDQHMTYVRHAYSRLAPGGRVVAVMSEGPFFREDSTSIAFRSWLEQVKGYSESLPENAFSGTDAFRRTSVRTRLVVIDKPSGTSRAGI